MTCRLVDAQPRQGGPLLPPRGSAAADAQCGALMRRHGPVHCAIFAAQGVLRHRDGVHHMITFSFTHIHA
eukprot:6203375-Pleurochrysis_carterae.AAC.1